MARWSLALLLGAPAVVEATLGCIDGSGHSEDFWYAFKYSAGWDYSYMTKGTKLAKASSGLDGDTSPVSRTLEQLYKGAKGLSYAFWNDEHPDGKKVDGPWAHAKGVLAFDGKSGFWLTHSLPQFPGGIKTGKPDYAGASDKYGQSYLCITIDAKAFNEVSKLAMVNRYSVYDAADNAKMGDSFTTWALDAKHGDDDTLITTVTSKGGQKFTAFAKSAKWDDELYGDLVAPHFKTSLYAETWQNGKGPIASWCEGKSHKYDVENVMSVNFPGKGFEETCDHSKWAVSSSQDSDAFCVGDINRQEGQYNRGGGTVCIEAKEFTDQMFNAVDTIEKCGKDKTIVV